MAYVSGERIVRSCLAAVCALGTSIFALAGRPGGDTCETAVDISGPLPIVVNGTTVGYANDYDEACPYPGSTAPDVVYKFTPTTDMVVDLTLCAGLTDFDTKLYIYDSCPPQIGHPIACNDDACRSAAGQDFVSALWGMFLQGGRTYYIVINGYGSAAGNYYLNISAGYGPAGCPSDGTTIFGQEPGLEDWTLAFSGYPAENFGDLEGRITGLRFWGLGFYYDQPHNIWDQCTANPASFTIRFYEDAGGQPGAEVCTYSLSIPGTLVGKVGFARYDLYEYSTALDPPCVLKRGWVSITGGSTSCGISWMSSDRGDARSMMQLGPSWWMAWPFDPALCLTSDYVPIYGACCDDTLSLCQENLALHDCHRRFLPSGRCADFNPPCGESTGTCCYADGRCAVTTRSACGGTVICPGDLNCDGRVTADDINAFVLALTSPAAYEQSYPACHILGADCNGDGLINFADINAFVARLGYTCGTMWLGPNTTCDQCPLRRIVIPNELPFLGLGTTCDRHNNYDATCLGPYDGGADVVYELIAAVETDAEITLDPNRTPYTSILLTSRFPPGPDCIATSTDPNGVLHSLGCRHFAPGTYYVMVDNWSAGGCIRDFELRINSCVPPTGRCCYHDPPQCAMTTEARCTRLGGTWNGALDCNMPCPTFFREDCAHAQVIPSVPFSVGFDNAQMTADGPAAPCDKYRPSGPMQNDAWFVWTAGLDCLATARVYAVATNDWVLAVRDDCANLTALYCADNDEVEYGAETIRFPAQSGRTYYFQVGTAGSHPAGGLTTFSLTCSTGSGACCFADGSCLILSGLDCISQGGDCRDDGTDCSTANCPQPAPSNNCADPVLVTLDAAHLPYVGHNYTTGRGNDYSDTCLGSFDSGEDIIYELTVTETLIVSITLDPNGTPYTGFLLSHACPSGDSCIVKSVTAGMSPHSVEYIVLVPGVYYLMVDSSLVPDGIPAFELRIAACETQLGACCITANQCVNGVSLVDCQTLGGNWLRGRTCDNYGHCPTSQAMTCANPIVVNVPAQLPYRRTDYTANRGNAYVGTTCLGVYDGGQDIIFKLVVTGREQAVDIGLAAPYDQRVRMALSDSCPPVGPCTVVAAYGMQGVVLKEGVHYLMIDIWPIRSGPNQWIDYTSFALIIRRTPTAEDEPQVPTGS